MVQDSRAGDKVHLQMRCCTITSSSTASHRTFVRSRPWAKYLLESTFAIKRSLTCSCSMEIMYLFRMAVVVVIISCRRLTSCCRRLVNIPRLIQNIPSRKKRSSYVRNPPRRDCPVVISSPVVVSVFVIDFLYRKFYLVMAPRTYLRFEVSCYASRSQEPGRPPPLHL
jgi:hypothetical protein